MQVDPKRRLTYSEMIQTPIYKALEKAGSIPKLAAALGVSRQAAYVWVCQGGAPLKRAIQIEHLYGKELGITRIGLLDPALKRTLTNVDATVEFRNRGTSVVSEGAAK